MRFPTIVLLVLLPVAGCHCSHVCPEGSFAAEGHCERLVDAAPDSAPDASVVDAQADADAALDSSLMIDSSLDADSGPSCFDVDGPTEGGSCMLDGACSPACQEGYDSACMTSSADVPPRCVYLPCGVAAETLFPSLCGSSPCPDLCGASGACSPWPINDCRYTL